MSLNDNLAIHEEDAQRINGVLLHFLGESGANESLLIDRSGQLLARGGASRSLDTVSLSALAAGAFSSTAAMARSALLASCRNETCGARALNARL